MRSFFIVSKNTMQTSAVSCRDALKKLNVGLIALPKGEAEAIRKLFAINIEMEDITESLEIN